MDGNLNKGKTSQKTMRPMDDCSRVGKGGLPSESLSPVSSPGKIRTGKVSGEKPPK